MIECIRSHEGGIVKTIGDAVMAARIQGKSLAGEIMLSEACFNDRKIQELINNNEWITKNITAKLKGIEPDPEIYSINIK